VTQHTPEQPNHEFSRGVHDYYASYVNNADAKIGALVALNVAIAGLLLDDVPERCGALVLTWIAVALHAVATAVLLFGLYPRSGKPGTSPLFWNDVQRRSSGQDYADEVAALSTADIERIYAVNNYVVAGVLVRKFAAVRSALLVTAAALLSGLASVIA
jgi:hypothetical protein